MINVVFVFPFKNDIPYILRFDKLFVHFVFTLNKIGSAKNITLSLSFILPDDVLKCAISENIQTLIVKTVLHFLKTRIVDLQFFENYFHARIKNSKGLWDYQQH